MRKIYEGVCHAEGDDRTHRWQVRITVEIEGDRAWGPDMDDVREFAECAIGLNDGEAEWEADNDLELVR